MKFFVTLAWTIAAAVGGAQTSIAQPRVAPTVDENLSIKRVSSPEISPDGRRVAYTVRETNWDDNTYDTQIWLADATTGALHQLTTAKKSSQSPAWSPDGTRLGFISDRTDKRQLYVINPLGGEAEALTSLDEGVSNFAWAPDGKTIAYTATEAKSAALKDREKKFGEFQVVEQDYRMTHLFVLNIATRASRALTSGPFTVGAFAWSPDGKSIAFDHRVNGSPASSGSAAISVVTVADGACGRNAHGPPGVRLRQRAERPRGGPPRGRGRAGGVGRRGFGARRPET